MIKKNFEIFNFLSPNDNDKLSSLSGIDLQELIVLIDECYIELRNTLYLDKNITFGVELEFENAMYERIVRKLDEEFIDGSWQIEKDESLNNGIEIITPILTDNEITWKKLDNVCTIVNPYASVLENSGCHIHIGSQILGNKKESWLNFIKLWSIYENIIFRFSYGKFLTARPSIKDYASPIGKVLWKDYKKLKFSNVSLEKIINTISHKRCQAVNFDNVSSFDFENGNTIEFRCVNGSLSSEICQNNVNFFAKLLLYSSNPLFDDDILEKRRRINKDKFYGLKWYDEIYLEQALELCDMIFDNNLDKIYFLRQYLKSFEVCKNPSEYPRAKPFVREKVKNMR